MVQELAEYENNNQTNRNPFQLRLIEAESDVHTFGRTDKLS